MREERVTGDRIAANIAARQHGVVSSVQLTTACGIDKDGIYRRVRAGRLHRVHRGVYAVGHPALSNEGRWMAAVVACGERAALSHRSAGELWRLLPARAGAAHVTVPGTGGRRKRGGIHIHRSAHLTDAVTTYRRGIRVTIPARTIADLRRTAPPYEVRKAIRQAEIAGYGLDGIETDRSRSDLERDFLRICRRHRLPLPEVNVRIGPYRVDFLWHGQKLIVETDGYQYHRGRQAFRDDRERDVALGLCGYAVHRFADETINEDPEGVAATLRSLLRIDR